MERDEVIRILDSGVFDGLVGAREDQELEFKRSPYRLDEPRQSFELAKDVSALANARGGLLLIGFATEREPESPLEIVSAVRPFVRVLANEQRCIEKLRHLLYPTVQGLRAEFKPTADDADRGVLLIDVPAQAERDKYFLIAEAHAAEEHLPGWVFGVAVRTVDRVEALRIGQLHSLVSGGLNIASRLDELTAQRAAAPHVAERTPADEIEERARHRLVELQRVLEEPGG
jgi:hypothetical protein